VFTNTVGGPLEPSNVLNRFQALLEAAGLLKQRFHDLRHCAASLLVAQGVPMRMVIHALGQSQMASMADHSGRVIQAAHREWPNQRAASSRPGRGDPPHQRLGVARRGAAVVWTVLGQTETMEDPPRPLDTGR
jgi:hypothetical protein